MAEKEPNICTLSQNATDIQNFQSFGKIPQEGIFVDASVNDLKILEFYFDQQIEEKNRQRQNKYFCLHP